ncbi:MAG TPA: UDP-N-acetylmuramoyl-L-alanine--D-glutamate ligase [Saprospiraceae bacterium]|nr:UDP-N-acetylmuramoyl-L-alanine--D-glutamate ligase [Saprospiraceae bacterium]
MQIVVLGAGESGVGAALLAKKLGYGAFVSDYGKIQAAYQAELKDKGIPYEEGQHDEERITKATEVVKSPGIPDSIPLIQQLKEKGIPVISEIEFAARHTQSKIVGITGTNGKTTTTRLTYHLLKEAGLDVGIGGNVGYSFARNVAEREFEWQVLELSSFQLDGIVDFRPNIAMLLNISPDHLDRYDYKMENYIAAKFRIAMNQTAADVLLYNEEDQNISAKLKELDLTVSLKAINSKYFVEGHLMMGDLNFNLLNTALLGRHNAMNAQFAIRVALELGIKAEQIQAGLESFKNDPHRMELVASIDGVRYINDSKATNVDAAYYALEAVSKPVIWIAGGQDKGNDYRQLQVLAREKVQQLICLGVDNRPLKEAFGNLLPTKIIETQDIKQALAFAKKAAQPGSTVLLSPACASFDLFNNYIDRGNQFKAAVNNIK